MSEKTKELEEQVIRMARLLLECRDALPAISLASAKLHKIDLTLAERIEDELKPWEIDIREAKENDIELTAIRTE